MMKVAKAASRLRYDALHYFSRVYLDQLTPAGPKLRQSRTSGSERAYVRFLAVEKSTGRIRQTARRRLDSIDNLLQQLEQYTDSWDVYACPNGYWRSGSVDGKPVPQWRYTTSQMRWFNSIVIDLDRKLLSSQMLALWERDPQAVLDAIHTRLAAAGISNYLIVQTNPIYGMQVHVLIEPCRANYQAENSGANSTATYREVSAALYRLLQPYGADRGAWKRPTQVFRIPGVSRPGYDGYRVELIIDHQEGERIGLYALFRRLFAMGLVLTPALQQQQRLQASKARRVRYLPWAGQRTLLSQRIAAGEFTGRGMSDGRKQTAYQLALALFAEARLHHPDRDNPEALRAHVEHLVLLWNRANNPPLPECIVISAVASAARGCGRVTGDLWEGVCETLGVRVAHPYAEWCHLAKDRSERKRDHQEEVEADLVAFFQSTGRLWEGVQGMLPELLQEFRGLSRAPSLRTVQRALRALTDRGLLQVETTRGRGGSTRIVLLATAIEEPGAVAPLNMSSANAGGAIAPDGVSLGKTVGGWECAREPVADLVSLCEELFGADAVVDCEQQDGAVEGLSRMPSRAAGESYRARLTRELATATESSIVGILARARSPKRMIMLLRIVRELKLEGRSIRLRDLVEGLRARCDELEGQAWRQLMAGRITAEDLDWLGDVLQDEPGDLQGLLAMAGEWGLEQLPHHRAALSRVRQRLRLVARTRLEVAAGAS